MTTTHDTLAATPSSPTVPVDGGEAVTDGLARLLADTYTLGLKTQSYHWNVTGPMFHTLHLLFETQYDELALAVDLIAERIRALGAPAPATYREFARLSTLGEDHDRPDATEMLHRLLVGQVAVIATAQSIVPAVETRPRRPDRRPPHPAHPSPREGGLDAPQPPRLTSRRTGAIHPTSN